MPWMKDSTTGEEKYKVSLYAKEELPTWSEIYEEFYLERIWHYSPQIPNRQILDPYWQFPHIKLLMGWVCNQFNKMMFEEEKRWNVIEKYQELFMDEDIIDIRFVLDYPLHKIGKEMEDRYRIGEIVPPPIYSCPLPTGKPNIFITNDHPRIDISLIKGDIFFLPLVQKMGNLKLTHKFIHPYQDTSDYNFIIDLLMKDIKEYFEGETIGWKDDKGQVIPSGKIERGCMGVGYDPAL